MTPREPPSVAGGTKTLRFRVRPGLVPAFTRLEMTVCEVGVIVDAGTCVQLVERVVRGEGYGAASRIFWDVNPSRRTISALTVIEAETLLRGASYRATYAKSRLSLGAGPVTLVEFVDPIEDQLVLIKTRIGQRVVPPDWASEDVTHDPSTEIHQIVVNASRERKDPEDDLGL